jgi:hypothetical protein
LPKVTSQQFLKLEEHTSIRFSLKYLIGQSRAEVDYGPRLPDQTFVFLSVNQKLAHVFLSWLNANLQVRRRGSRGKHFDRWAARRFGCSSNRVSNAVLAKDTYESVLARRFGEAGRHEVRLELGSRHIRGSIY